MTTKPLAEMYEELKQLRREGDSAGLDALVRKAMGMGIPGLPESPAGFVRQLDIRALAERVFGDPARAEGWLNRPNTSLSGQRPADLLHDDLGAAVVRETLEQIDHGIFA
ncbi:hypothetical protein RPB_4183 [Rhodopseudomonas palustris HaA2]|uniref:Antitoxin Xre/MbcA/ParS-like toxin-binding domain-containing protein n=1 Tax=Rhodopseudomonas palustris (strain HaA2) TaxID=316058 RepID=Q2ISD5_RHOP2|nr:MbcA/ParS/Xre antitoxin family protein [Rhodopseudomonas palustris]ABD08875.1 hypothetical protein RPB_4183 [Rhodopseudomonas palustris HaA2]